MQKDPESISAVWEWRWDHWGTSRNASDAECLITDDGKAANFPFATAWNPPVALIDSVAARFPALVFKLAFYYDNHVGFGLWMHGGQLGSLVEVPSSDARRLLNGTTIQAEYDRWIENDDENDEGTSTAER